MLISRSIQLQDWHPGLFDFLCFQNAFVRFEPYADCDGNNVLNIFDFLCFQNAFVAGCP